MALRPQAVRAALRPGAVLAALRRRTGTVPRLSRWAWLSDVALAVVLAAATWYTAANPVLDDADRPLPIFLLPDGRPAPPVPPASPGPHDTGLWAAGDAPVTLLVLAAVCTLPLVLRRRFPLAAFWSVLALTVTFHAVYDTGVSPDGTAVFTFAACLLAGYSAALYGPYRVASLASVGIGAVVIIALYQTNVPAITPVYVPFFVLVPVALAANAIHGWKQRLRVAETDRQAATTQAVERERTRIARELHDVVTHHVSVMVVQAGAARTVLDSDPERARQVLLSVESSGREAMGELRDVMGLLAGSVDVPPGEDAPQPGLGQLETLVDRVRVAGVPVRLTVTGDPVALPAGPDLAAYRVVQEALTNTIKHADGAAAMVCVEYRPERLRIEVNDSGGSRSATAGSGGGRGLIGLRERLALYGGTLHAGPSPDGGFQVRAEIPFGAGVPDDAKEG
jgi:signal transduction histidine kinase